ncbi:NAD(P)-binding protein [Mycena metata]|uniref:NAD(P)-binding protein n=1 Tax=Mycena metata TaxID=1033252 RepID=A0AAD7IVS0_9AGAR|nr:NAD(P)-binding protein [Mycena metata]
MTITNTTSASLIAVFGATRVQGGSVIKALADSDKQYRVRGFTRDATEVTAEALKKKGVEMVINLAVKNREEGLLFAELDSHAVALRLVTNFWEHTSMEAANTEGILLTDTARAGGVKGIIWSGLMSVTKISGGKYTHVYHFDGNAAVTNTGATPVSPKQADGSYAIALPARPETVLPIIDMDDYGLYVRRVLEAPMFPDGSEVLTSRDAGSLGLPALRSASQLTIDTALTYKLARYKQNVVVSVYKRLALTYLVTGKKVIYKQLTADDCSKTFSVAGLPPHIVAEQLVEDYSSKPSSSREGLARPVRSHGGQCFVLCRNGAVCPLTHLANVLLLNPAALTFRALPRPRCSHAFSGFAGVQLIPRMILASGVELTFAYSWKRLALHK